MFPHENLNLQNTEESCNRVNVCILVHKGYNNIFWLQGYEQCYDPICNLAPVARFKASRPILKPVDPIPNSNDT